MLLEVKVIKCPLYFHFEDARLKEWGSSRKGKDQVFWSLFAKYTWSAVVDPVATSYHLRNFLFLPLNQGERALDGKRKGILC